jgi:hypothetical protein
MANDSMEPGENGVTGSPRKRRGPTIEGSATEIVATPIATEPSGEEESVSAPPETAAAPADAPETGDTAAPASTGEATSGTESSPDPASQEPPDASPDAEPQLEHSTSGGRWRAVLAGAAAAAVVGAVAGGAAYWLRPPDSTPEILARLTRAEARLTDLAGRTPAIGRETINDMAARIGQIEAKIADLKSVAGPTGDIPADRLQAAERAAATASERVDALARQAAADRQMLAALDQRLSATQKGLADLTRDEPAKMAALESRLAAAMGAVTELRTTLEGALKETRAALAAVVEPPALKAVRLAVAAQALETAVARGAPYQNELAAMRALSADAAVLAPLDAFAATGLPGTDALAAEFFSLAPKLTAAAGAGPREDSILAKFTANAEKLVRVRPTGDAAGDDAGAVIARMEARVRRGDLSGALAESQKLPPEAKALAEPWVKRVEARQAARAGAQKLAAAALAAAATEGKK